MINYQKRQLLFFSIGVLSVYVLCIFILSNLHHVSFDAVILFNPEIKTLPANLIALYSITVISGWLLIYLIPGLIWSRAFLKVPYAGRPGLLFQSFLLSILLLVLSTSLFKIITHQALNRTNFLGIISFLIIVGLIFYCSQGGSHKRTGNPAMIDWGSIIIASLGVILIALLIYIFRGKIFIENFSEGGIEFFYPSTFLKARLFPYGDLEIGGRFGLLVSEPYWMIVFLNLFNLLLFGECEGSIRLHFFLYLYMLYILINAFVGSKKMLNALSLAIFLFLFTTITFFYVGHNAYFEDIAANISFLLFTLQFCLGIYFLLNREKNYFLITALFSILTLWTGVILYPILLFAYWIYFKEERKFSRKVVCQYIILVSAVAFSYMIYGWTTGLLGDWYLLIKKEYLDELIFIPNRYGYMAVFFWYFVIYAGGLPVLSLFVLKSKDRMVCLFSLVTLLYLIVVFKSTYINLHYFAPVILLPMASFLRQTDYLKRTKYNLARGLLILCLAIFIIISWPKGFSIHTVYRDFGTRTCMLFDSFEEAYRHRNITDLEFKDDIYFSHYIDIETIPYYADITLTPNREYDYYITAAKSPPVAGVELLAAGKGIYLFARDINRHIEFNKRHKTYPSRENVSSRVFKEIFAINIGYDDAERDYFYY